MSTTLAQLLAVRSRYAQDIDAFCDEAIRRLDSTGLFYKGNASDPAAISISRTGVDARVFTSNPKPDETGCGRAERNDDDDGESALAKAHDKALAALDEHPWLTDERESIAWSRALADATKGMPLVIRDAPGSGKTTLSRFSTVKRLEAVRAALKDYTKLPEDCDPTLWLTCSALAQCEQSQDEPADLVINGAFRALALPQNHPAASPRVRVRG